MPRARNTVRYTIEATILAALAIAVFLPWGCGRSPVGPEYPAGAFALPNGVTAQPGQLLGETEAALPGQFTMVADAGVATAAAIVTYGPFVADIDSNGGQIAIDVDGEVSFFVVPLGALDAAARISVTVDRGANDAGDRVTTFAFEPAGLHFSVPAYLAYKSVLSEGEMQKLYWYDSLQDLWLASAVAVAADGYATFPIEHFSDYGTTEQTISLGGQ